MAAHFERATGLPALREPVPIVQVIRADDMSDAELGQAAAVAVDQSMASRADSVEKAVRAGELLRAAKERCRAQGRSWSDWCRRYWPKSRRTADTYIAVALEVNHGEIGGRAPNVSAALTCPSVRALLTDAGIGAGGTRDRSEPDGMREPGADEGEEDLSDAPRGERMEGLTEREQATVDRLSAEQAQSDQERAAERLRKRDEWRAKQEAERRQAMTDEEKARRVALAADAAKQRAEREAELAAIQEAHDRPAGPPPTPQRPRPADADEVRDSGPACADMERLIRAVQRRWELVVLEPAPPVERYGRPAKHPRDEEHDFISEWVNGGAETIRRLRVMAQEDAKIVAQARKRRGQA